MKKVLVVFALTIVALGVCAMASDGSKSDLKMVGWIGDQRCSAKVAQAGTVSASDVKCIKACLERGEKVVFINQKEKSVVLISNPEAVKGHEGDHVTVTGSIIDDMLHVDSVTTAVEH